MKTSNIVMLTILFLLIGFYVVGYYAEEYYANLEDQNETTALSQTGEEINVKKDPSPTTLDESDSQGIEEERGNIVFQAFVYSVNNKLSKNLLDDIFIDLNSFLIGR